MVSNEPSNICSSTERIDSFRYAVSMNRAIGNNYNAPANFWGEIAPCEHLVQIYADEDIFLTALEGFVASGLDAGDGVVVIATPSHRHALEQRLQIRGFDLAAANLCDQFIPLDAEETLARFMVDGWPDDERFGQMVAELVGRAGHGGRRVRAFGEMVSLLWARGDCGATVRLEYLWNNLCRQGAFSLFCAYPKIGFTESPDIAVQAICAVHSRVISDADYGAACADPSYVESTVEASGCTQPESPSA
jgi:hypothetical protein